MTIIAQTHILKEIKNIKKQLKAYKPPIFLKNEIMNIALAHLKVSDANQLRDKFEGVEYLKKMTHRILSIKAVEKVLNKEIVKWDKIQEKPNSLFSRNISYTANYEIVSFSYDNLPSIPTEFRYPFICILIRDENCAYVAGVLNKIDFQNEENFIQARKLGSVDKTRKTLYNLTCLKPIEDN